LFPGIGLLVRLFQVFVLKRGGNVLFDSQTGRAHLLLISLTPGKAGGAIGVITLEDIIEVRDLNFFTCAN
jgi:hypothetical protein